MPWRRSSCCCSPLVEAIRAADQARQHRVRGHRPSHHLPNAVSSAAIRSRCTGSKVESVDVAQSLSRPRLQFRHHPGARHRRVSLRAPFHNIEDPIRLRTADHAPPANSRPPTESRRLFLLELYRAHPYIPGSTVAADAIKGLIVVPLGRWGGADEANPAGAKKTDKGPPATRANWRRRRAGGVGGAAKG